MTTRATWSSVVSVAPLLMLLMLQLMAQTNAHDFRLMFKQMQQQQQQQQPVDKMDELWLKFKTTYRKSYADDAEDSYRRSVWLENVARVQTHNIQADLGLHTFTMGINEYSDLTMEEYKQTLLGTRPPTEQLADSVDYEPVGDDEEYRVAGANGLNAEAPLSDNKPTNQLDQSGYYGKDDDSDEENDLPETVDWRIKGYVTSVKNQGSCGSCWAFSSTGALEGQNFKKTGNLVSLSEQNLVDCTKTCGNNGCGGGWMSWAFKCVSQQGGIDTEESYPYEGKDGSCRFKTSTIGAKCTGFKSLPVGDEQALQQAVATVGPISVAIDANHPEFFQYKSGVLNIPECTDQVDHGVLVVGYGTQNGQDYWLVKNSWGTSWGINGYVMMARNKNNQCAIASYAVYPTM